MVVTPECVSYVMLCCIYVAGLFGYTYYSVNVVCYVCDCSVLVLGGGGDLPTCGGRGVLLMIFRFSSGGLLVWGHFGLLACVVLVIPGELCPGAPCW